MWLDLDGFFQSTEFLTQLAAFISALLSAMVGGLVTQWFPAQG